MHEQLSQPLEINRHSPEIMTALAVAPVYKKQGEVKAVIAQGGEKIATVLGDGTEETTNTANPGEVIITNPGGEQYIIKPDKFGKKYEPKAGEEGVYVAKGHCKAIDNPFGTSITMKASWGEMQNGQADCKIADTYDPETDELGGEPYIIGRSEFEHTYKPVASS